MCEICEARTSGDEKKMKEVRDAHNYRADQLQRMADFERWIGDGKFNPHSEDSKKVGALARILIRYLVEDWL